MFNYTSVEILPVLLRLEDVSLSKEWSIKRLNAGPSHKLRGSKALDQVANENQNTFVCRSEATYYCSSSFGFANAGSANSR
jgi:hypothetical protein